MTEIPRNKQVVSQLKLAIEQSLPNQNPIFIIAGCEKSWVEFDSFLDPNPEKTPTDQIAEVMKPLIGSFVEQHGNECGADHDIYYVIRRINEARQTNSLYEATSLVRLATQKMSQ